MNLLIELDEKLPYALVPSTRNEDDAYEILDLFNAYAYNGDEAAGAHVFTLWPDYSEHQQWMGSIGAMFAVIAPRQVRINEINSILATKR